MKDFQQLSRITCIDVWFDGETVWLTQNALSELFQTTKQNIGQHIKKIFQEGELQSDSVVKNFFTTATEGKKYITFYYNLDLIISVGINAYERLDCKTGNQRKN
jgi:hypothetical protein